MRDLVLRSSLLALLAVSGCSGPPAPDGFELAIQLMSVQAVAVDSLRITFIPRMDAGGPRRFADMEPITYEGGAVTVDVDEADGALVMTITGDYVRSHIVNDDPINPRFVIEIWSDDEAMRQGPQVNATVVRMSEQIATGSGYLPTWPLMLGETSQINVPCLGTQTALCMPM